MTRLVCPYCHKQRRDKGIGWHKCKAAAAAQKRLATVLGTIEMDMERPGYSAKTNSQIKNRADSIKMMATSVKLNGGQVRADYEGVNYASS